MAKLRLTHQEAGESPGRPLTPSLVPLTHGAPLHTLVYTLPDCISHPSLFCIHLINWLVYLLTYPVYYIDSQLEWHDMCSQSKFMQ